MTSFKLKHHRAACAHPNHILMLIFLKAYRFMVVEIKQIYFVVEKKIFSLNLRS